MAQLVAELIGCPVMCVNDAIILIFSLYWLTYMYLTKVTALPSLTRDEISLSHRKGLITQVENRVIQNSAGIGIVLHFMFLAFLAIVTIRIPPAIHDINVDLANYPSSDAPMPIVAKDGHVDFLQVRLAMRPS